MEGRSIVTSAFTPHSDPGDHDYATKKSSEAEGDYQSMIVIDKIDEDVCHMI